MNAPNSIRTVLQSEFKNRVTKNSKFSLRSFARYLDMPVSTLSTILAGESHPTATTIRMIAKKLAWDEELTKSLQIKSKEAKDSKMRVQNSRKNILPQNELLKSLVPLTVLTLAKTGLFDVNPQTLAIHLGLNESHVSDALESLFSLGLVYEDGGKLRVHKPIPVIIEDPDGPLLKSYLSQWLEHGSKQSVSAHNLDSNAITFQIVTSRKNLQRLRSKFEAFARSIRKDFPDEGAKGEVYSVGAVVYPFRIAQTK